MRGLPKGYLLHTNPSKFRELGKTRQATCFLLSILNHWSFTEHTSWSYKPRLPNSPDETHELGSWAKKWDDMSWAWTMGFDAFLCEYELFWALEEIFPKSVIMLMWCGSPMKWSYVVWKICSQHPLTWNIYPWSFVMWNVKLVKKNKQGNQHTYEWTQKVLIVSFFLQLRSLECSKRASASSKFSFYRSEKVSGKIPAHKWGEMRT